MSTTATPTSDALVFEVQGDSLKLFVNGNLATYAQDTTATAVSSGSVGMFTMGAAGKASIANFSAQRHRFRHGVALWPRWLEFQPLRQSTR